MRIAGEAHRTIWHDRAAGVRVIDQAVLPHRFAVRTLGTAAEAATAIRDMTVRGAPLIGAPAAYGVALAMAEDPGAANLAKALDLLIATRPTAVNLRWGLERMRRHLERLPEAERAAGPVRGGAGRAAGGRAARGPQGGPRPRAARPRPSRTRTPTPAPHWASTARR